MKRWACAALALFAASASPLAAQGLREQIEQLFIFGDGESPLFLSGTADPNNPAGVQAHGEHFIPAAQASNATVIEFLTSAIGTNITNIPISATSSGVTFRFEGGVPVQTSTSPGPIFAERGQTLGRGRVLVSASVNVFNFKSLRGVDLDQVSLNFAHENSDFPSCDTIFMGDCGLHGFPDFENDVIRLDLEMDLDVIATMFLLTYGLHDRIDIGMALPIISADLRGRSVAEVLPFGADVNHFFTGTQANPGLTAERTVQGSATGLGDIATRVKIAVGESENARFSILGDARWPTGDEEDLLGSGEFSLRALGIVSAQFGAFSPHANIGYLYRRGEFRTGLVPPDSARPRRNDAVLVTVGFDHLLAPWAALAVDVVSELQVGSTELLVPEDVTLEAPFRRTIRPTNIPNTRDDIVNGSIGFKFVTPSGLILVANSIWPLNEGGLRTDVSWTAGLEYNF